MKKETFSMGQELPAASGKSLFFVSLCILSCFHAFIYQAP